MVVRADQGKITRGFAFLGEEVDDGLVRSETFANGVDMDSAHLAATGRAWQRTVKKEFG